MISRFKNIKRRLNSDAVSAAMSLTLVLMIFFSATGAVMVWGPGYIESEENKHNVASTVNLYNLIDPALASLIEDGNGSSYLGELAINDGTIEIDSKGERVIIVYSASSDWGFDVDGLENNDNLFSVSGPSVDNVNIYWIEDTCFLAGTKVSMADGSLKNIEDVKSGDLVISYDEVSGEFTVARVNGLLCHSENRMSNGYLVINDKLRVTPNHRLFAGGRWVEAGKLSVDDVVIGSVERVFSREVSYDLLLDSGNVYFADGFLVKSDVEQVVVSDLSGVSRMSCVPFSLSPLGAEDGPCSGYVYSGDGGRILYPQYDTFYGETDEFRVNGDYSHLIMDHYTACLLAWARDRIALKFNFASSSYNIPLNSVVEDARLGLYYYSKSGNCVTGKPIDVHEMSAPWTEGNSCWKYSNKNQEEHWPGVCRLIGTYPDACLPPVCPYFEDYEPYHYKTNPTVKLETSFIPSLPDDEGIWMEWQSDLFTSSVQHYVQSPSSNYGWLLSSTEGTWTTTCPSGAWFYSKEASSNKPYLKVWYVYPPEVIAIDVGDVLNVDYGSDWVVVKGRLMDDGLRYATESTHDDLTTCTIYYKLSEYGKSYNWAYYSGSHDSCDLFSKRIDGLVSGDLYQMQTRATNPSDEYTDSVYFFTPPPKPAGLSVSRDASDNVHVSWTKASLATGATVYTKVLAKANIPPTDPNDDSATVLYWGPASGSTTFPGQGKTWCIRAWTWAEEQPYPTSDPPTYYGRWSIQYRDQISNPSSPPTTDPPVADFTGVDADVTGAGKLVNFSASASYDPDGGSITSYEWDWTNDGSFDNSTSSPTITHTYPSYSSYDVNLRVTDDDGETGFIVKPVSVLGPGNNPPVADFTGVDADGTGAGKLVDFDASASYDPDGDSITSYEWDWTNDGSFDFSTSSPTTSYTYPNYGSYSVNLRVTDDGGLTGSRFKPVSVQGPDNTPTVPIDFEVEFNTWLEIYENPWRFYNDTDYKFSAFSSCSAANIYYEFDWGDGSNDYYGPYTAGQQLWQSGGTFPSHSWAESGVKEIRARAIYDDDADGDGDPRNSPYASPWSDPFVIRVYWQFIEPPDRYRECISLPPDSPNAFIAPYDLTGFVCIYLFNDNYPSSFDPARGEVPFGVIYLSDLGSISHDIFSSSGEYKIIYQSGGVLSVLPTAGVNVDCFSNVYERGDTLGFTVAMIRGDGSVAGSGAGTYSFDFRNIHTYTREQQEYTVYNFKVKFVGGYSSYWHDFLVRSFKFAGPGGNGFLLYDGGRGKQLVFTTALLRASLQ